MKLNPKSLELRLKQATTSPLTRSASGLVSILAFIASGFLVYRSYPSAMPSAILEVFVVTLLVGLLGRKGEAQSESEPVTFPKKKTHPQAVIGFVDMTSSSALTNLVGISRDWEIKQKFFGLAALRAEEFGMTVLNHTGDGFLFIANFGSTSDWQFNIIAFFETLACDFELLRISELKEDQEIETGIRFGLALGPAVIGLISGAPSYFTAVGADVNLAARLTAVANNNQLVLTSRIWHSLKPLLIGWEASEEKHQIKGFADPIPCVRITRRLGVGQVRVCPVCYKNLQVKKTDEGEINISCEDGHPSVLPLPSIVNRRLFSRRIGD